MGATHLASARCMTSLSLSASIVCSTIRQTEGRRDTCHAYMRTAAYNTYVMHTYMRTAAHNTYVMHTCTQQHITPMSCIYAHSSIQQLCLAHRHTAAHTTYVMHTCIQQHITPMSCIHAYSSTYHLYVTTMPCIQAYSST